MSKKGTTSGAEKLDFIQDNELRKTIEDAIQYIYIIFDQAKDSKSELYKEETYRCLRNFLIQKFQKVP